MIRTQWFEPDGSVRWGLGLEHWTISGRDMAGHGGLLLGYKPRVAFDIERQRGVVILNNAIDAPTVSMLKAIITSLEKVDDAALGNGGENPLLSDRFCGRFRNSWGSYAITRLGSALVGLGLEGDELLDNPDILEVLNENELSLINGAFGSHVGQTIAYNFDATGKPSSVNYGSYRGEWIGEL